MKYGSLGLGLAAAKIDEALDPSTKTLLKATLV